MPRRYDISKTPVMPTKCATCPFSAHGCRETAKSVVQRVLSKGSQMCHSSGWPEGKRLCRGARDIQLRVFASMGFIDAPTDEAWDAKRKELGV